MAGCPELRNDPAPRWHVGRDACADCGVRCAAQGCRVEPSRGRGREQSRAPVRSTGVDCTPPVRLETLRPWTTTCCAHKCEAQCRAAPAKVPASARVPVPRQTRAPEFSRASTTHPLRGGSAKLGHTRSRLTSSRQVRRAAGRSCDDSSRRCEPAAAATADGPARYRRSDAERLNCGFFLYCADLPRVARHESGSRAATSAAVCAAAWMSVHAACQRSKR